MRRWSAARLVKLQQLPCLAVRGVTSIILGSVLECCLNTIPLFIQAMARKSDNVRDYGSIHNHLGHSKIIAVVMRDCILEVISNHINTHYSFPKPFSVVTPHHFLFLFIDKNPLGFITYQEKNEKDHEVDYHLTSSKQLLYRVQKKHKRVTSF